MGRKRDSWDKSNRQRKAQNRRVMPNGPSPLGEFLLKIKAKRQRLLEEKKQQRRTRIEAQAELEWRQFSIPVNVREWLVSKNWLGSNKGDELRLVQAVQATLARRPIAMESIPYKFWLYCRSMDMAVAEISESPSKRSFKPPKTKILYWLKKFGPSNFAAK
jgi:hypothetical protein